MVGLGSFASGLASGVETGMRFGLLRKEAEREEKELTLLEENRNMVMDNKTFENYCKIADKSHDPVALQAVQNSTKYNNPAYEIMGQAYTDATVSERKAIKEFSQETSDIVRNPGSPDALDKATASYFKCGTVLGMDSDACKAIEKQITYIKEKGIKEDEKDASAVAGILTSYMGMGKRPSEYGLGEVERGWEPSQYGRVGLSVSNEDLNTLAETNARNEPAYMEGVKRAIAMTKASREAEKAGMSSLITGVGPGGKPIRVPDVVGTKVFEKGFTPQITPYKNKKTGKIEYLDANKPEEIAKIKSGNYVPYEKSEKPEKPEIKPLAAASKIAQIDAAIARLKKGSPIDAFMATVDPKLGGLLGQVDEESMNTAIATLNATKAEYMPYTSEGFRANNKSQKTRQKPPPGFVDTGEYTGGKKVYHKLGTDRAWIE